MNNSAYYTYCGFLDDKLSVKDLIIDWKKQKGMAWSEDTFVIDSFNRDINFLERYRARDE